MPTQPFHCSACGRDYAPIDPPVEARLFCRECGGELMPGPGEGRAKAADACFTDLIEKDLGEMRRESREKLEKAQRIARVFRFICPSYYIPGKQSWGAF